MKRKILLIVLIVLTLLWIIFIHSNSLDNGAESTEKSSFVTALVNNIASAIGITKPISHAFVRKLAHFTEFAILSLFVCADILVALLPMFIKKPLRFIGASTSALGISFFVACVDELLQKFSDGRAAQLTDVLIDTLGALCGAVIFTAIFFIIIQIFKKSLYTDSKL